MNSYVILVRGINVGGKSRVSMSELKIHLEELEFSLVQTYINSGNVLVSSNKNAQEVQEIVENVLAKEFKLDNKLNKVLVLTQKQLESVVKEKPKGFGEEPEKYHSDVLFVMDTTVKEVMPIFSPKEGVDTIWPGDEVIYSQRLSAKQTQSRLNKIMLSPLYKSLTIRNWNTTVTLTKLLDTVSGKLHQ